jgi:hypothetical protein
MVFPSSIRANRMPQFTLAVLLDPVPKPDGKPARAKRAKLNAVK